MGGKAFALLCVQPFPGSALLNRALASAIIVRPLPRRVAIGGFSFVVATTGAVFAHMVRTASQIAVPTLFAAAVHVLLHAHQFNAHLSQLSVVEVCPFLHLDLDGHNVLRVATLKRIAARAETLRKFDALREDEDGRVMVIHRHRHADVALQARIARLLRIANYVHIFAHVAVRAATATPTSFVNRIM